MPINPLSYVLQSLVPRDAEEMSLLKVLLTSVRAMHRRAYADLGFARVAGGSNVTLASGYSASEELLAAIPTSDKRYFDGLVEAFEIYQSIHGEAVPVESLSDLALRELRRIRDLCLDSGPILF